MGLGVALAGDGNGAARCSGPQVAVPLAGLGKAGGQGAAGAGQDAGFLLPPGGPQQGRDGVLFQSGCGGKGVARQET